MHLSAPLSLYCDWGISKIHMATYLQTFDAEPFIECIKELIRVDRDWIPEGVGYSIYLRPTAISTYVSKFALPAANRGERMSSHAYGTNNHSLFASSSLVSFSVSSAHTHSHF